MYCPSCQAELDGTSDDQLCYFCKWFGDKSELLPVRDDGEVVATVAKALTAFRDVCRGELQNEALVKLGREQPESQTLLRIKCNESKETILALFRRMWLGYGGEDYTRV